MLKLVVSSGKQYDYVHFFQGADLPIKTQDEIHDFFSMNNGKEFVSIEYSRQKMAENKCHYLHFFCHNRFFRKNKAMKALNFGLVAIQKMSGVKVNKTISFHQGSALFSITIPFAKYLIEKEREIKHIFRFSLAADECFIQTMLLRSPFCNNIYLNAQGNASNARLIDRMRPDGKNSPHIWRDDEFDTIIAQPEDVCFARKFDASIAPNVVRRVSEKYGSGE